MKRKNGTRNTLDLSFRCGGKEFPDLRIVKRRDMKKGKVTRGVQLIKSSNMEEPIVRMVRVEYNENKKYKKENFIFIDEETDEVVGECGYQAALNGSVKMFGLGKSDNAYIIDKACDALNSPDNN